MDQLRSSQLSEWEAYDRLDPVGTWRDDFRMAYLSSIVTNLVISVYGTGGTEMKVPLDFMPDWMKDSPDEVKKQSVEEQKAILYDIARSQKRKGQSRTSIQKQAQMKKRKS